MRVFINIINQTFQVSLLSLILVSSASIEISSFNSMSGKKTNMWITRILKKKIKKNPNLFFITKYNQLWPLIYNYSTCYEGVNNYFHVIFSGHFHHCFSFLIYQQQKWYLKKAICHHMVIFLIIYIFFKIL